MSLDDVPGDGYFFLWSTRCHDGMFTGHHGGGQVLQGCAVVVRGLLHALHGICALAVDQMRHSADARGLFTAGPTVAEVMQHVTSPDIWLRLPKTRFCGIRGLRGFSEARAC